MKSYNNVTSKTQATIFSEYLVGVLTETSHFISIGKNPTVSYTRHKESPLSSREESSLDDLPVDYSGAGEGVLEGILYNGGMCDMYLPKGGDGQSFVSFWEGKFDQEEDFLLDRY